MSNTAILNKNLGGGGSETVSLSGFLPTFTATVHADGSRQILGQAMFPSSVVFEDDRWVAVVILIPGCVSEGATRDEAKASLKEALEDILEIHRSRGTWPSFVPPEDPEIPPSSLFNLIVDVEAPQG